MPLLVCLGTGKEQGSHNSGECQKWSLFYLPLHLRKVDVIEKSDKSMSSERTRCSENRSNSDYIHWSAVNINSKRCKVECQNLKKKAEPNLTSARPPEVCHLIEKWDIDMKSADLIGCIEVQGWNGWFGHLGLDCIERSLWMKCCRNRNSSC